MKTYRERVREAYRKNRAENHAAKRALCHAKYQARYSNGRKCPFDNSYGYPGSETKTLPNGWELRFSIEYDNYPEFPWENSDGVGVIEESRSHPGKSYSDWILDSGRGWYSYYDWKATLPIAIKDGWDAPPYNTGTKREQAMRAMRMEYERFERWCQERWHYVYLSVVLLDENGHELSEDSCGGYESSDSEYLTKSGRTMARYLLIAARKEQRNKRRQARIESRFADAMACGV